MSIPQVSLTSQPLSDDQILGLPVVHGPREPRREAAAAKSKSGSAGKSGSGGNLPAVSDASADSGQQTDASQPTGDADGDSAASPERTEADGAPKPVTKDPEEYGEIFEANPELKNAWENAQEYREIFPDIEDARQIQKLFSTSTDAHRAAEGLAEMERLDSMFLGNRPESLAELAASVYRIHPEAFENLARIMGGMLRSGNLSQETRPHPNGNSGEPANSRDSERTSAAADVSRPEAGTARARESAGGPRFGEGDRDVVAHRATFLQDTNTMAVEGVMEAIKSQVQRLLPEEVSPAVQKRIVGEVYRELDSSLRANRTLMAQVREAFRAGGFDAAHQKAMADLLVGRARQGLPGVAKKVIEEWTSNVLAASERRHANQRTAERRVDIANAGPAASEVRRTLAPTDINYAKSSDADILNM
jgi:hypothetical protein